MVREDLFKQYGEKTYVSGIKGVHHRPYGRSKGGRCQRPAGHHRLTDRRHGYRGPEGLVVPPENASEAEDAAEEALDTKEIIADQVPAVVLKSDAKQLVVHTQARRRRP